MGFSLNIEFMVADLIKRQAIVRALNRTALNVQTTLVRAVAADSGLPVTAVRDRFRIESASDDQLEVRVLADSRPLPLITFGASGPEPSRGKGAGVTSRLKGGAGRYPHAFLTTMPSGHRGVFQRSGRARLPIRELRGPSVHFLARKFLDQAETRAREQFPINLNAQEAFANLAA